MMNKIPSKKLFRKEKGVNIKLKKLIKKLILTLMI